MFAYNRRYFADAYFSSLLQEPFIPIIHFRRRYGKVQPVWHRRMKLLTDDFHLALFFIGKNDFRFKQVPFAISQVNFISFRLTQYFYNMAALVFVKRESGCAGQYIFV